jgi:hypothetical protein
MKIGREMMSEIRPIVWSVGCSCALISEAVVRVLPTAAAVIATTKQAKAAPGYQDEDPFVSFILNTNRTYARAHKNCVKVL